MRPNRILAFALSAALVLGGCDNDPSGTRDPETLEVFAGNGQPGAAGAELPNPLVVRVADDDGEPLRGVTVTWAVGSGGGSVAPQTSVTDRSGLASARWTLGTSAAAAQTVTATVEGLPAVTFTATPQAAAFAAFRFVPDSLRLAAIGETATLQAQAVDRFGNPAASPTVTWTSLDPTIVQVFQSGTTWTVRAVANGRGRVQASGGGVNDTLIVNVRQVARTVTLSPNPNQLAVGDTVRLTATARDANANVVANAVFQWSSSAPAVASVDPAGKVTGVSAGTATITASTDSASGTAHVVVQAALAARSLDAGGSYSCATNAAGATYCWGYPSNGIELSRTPARKAAGLALDSVTAGGAHVCGLTPGGTVYCWGLNERGQVGSRANDAFCRVSPNFSYTCVATPTEVQGTYRQVSAGDEHTCALTASGQAYCWGLNGSGQLGAASGETCSTRLVTADPQPCSTTPIPVQGGMTFVSISAGGRHTCARNAAGQTFCWGDNSQGALGNGTTTSSSAPVRAGPALAFASVSAGTGYTCAVTAAGTGYCWGGDDSGRLGNGGAGSTSSPDEVGGGPVWREIVAGRLHTCGIRTTGAAYCWGRNAEGQLGTGAAGGISESPVPVSGDLAFSAIRPSGGIAGQLRDNGSLGQRTFTCGIQAGTRYVYCWGANNVHQVGDDTMVDRPAPVLLRQP